LTSFQNTALNKAILAFIKTKYKLSTILLDNFCKFGIINSGMTSSEKGGVVKLTSVRIADTPHVN